MRIHHALVALAVTAVAGCGAPPGAAAPTPGPPDPVVAQHPAKHDAGAILKTLQTKDLGLTNIAVQNEDTDPNHLLGRPGGYTSRASADLPGGDRSAERGDSTRGIVAEVFDTADLARKRGEYIEQLMDGSSIFGTEWHYYTPDGTGLVRVSGNVKPSLAKRTQAAVATL